MVLMELSNEWLGMVGLDNEQLDMVKLGNK